MRGVWLEDRRLRLRDDLALPDPPPGEVRVRVLCAGICNTDLELVRGYLPFRGIPGHEFVGRVDGDARWPGGRVVGEINAACGACSRCRQGRGRHCATRTVLGIAGRDGAFAEWLLLPAANLRPVPEGLATEAALFAEPLAAALEVREQVAAGAGTRALVVGDGKLGQLVARVLALAGCELRVVGRHPRKLALLAEAGVAALAPDAIEEAAFDLAVECTGNPDGYALARRAVRPRGTVVLKSTYAGSLSLRPDSLVVDEITVIGSRCGRLDAALPLLASGEVDPRPLLDARYPLGEALDAFDHAARPGTLKIAIDLASGD
jgi:threonine dehydrogenase-like Zn-dependent dehydrogenase